MSSTLPTDQKDRAIIVDVIRGFALVGVLMANFTSYVDQQTPDVILDKMSSPFDRTLMNINSVFFEWKFMTLFSILFGYGFGLILEGLKRKNIHPTMFFLRRMFWLFVFGAIHCLFWWADVLHLYAMAGVLLLLFRNRSQGFLLASAILFMFIIPPIISYGFRHHAETFTNADITELYNQYKNGTVIEVIQFNLRFYYRMFILSDYDLHDIAETLGRFLFGYFLLRIGLFRNIETKKPLFKKIALISAPVMVCYFILRWSLLNDNIHLNEFVVQPILSVGILSTTCFYVSLLALAHISFGMNRFFRALQSLGRMTLTNYLMVSKFLVILLYGFGFNQLGVMPMHTIWALALLWLVFEILFSSYWLKYFRYGPVEWIWRQLTYRKRLPLRK